jgi:hypothetical protein
VRRGGLGGGGLGLLGLLGLLGSGGCREVPAEVVRLPDLLTAVVRQEDGSYRSLALSLPRPREPLIVREAPGVVALGPGWARAAAIREGGRGGLGTYGVHLEDLGPTALRADRSLGPDGAAILGVHPGGLWLSGPEGAAWLGLADQRNAEPSAGGSLWHPGPGRGFALSLDAGRLRLETPHARPRDPDLLPSGVEAVVGSWWLSSARLPVWEQRLLEQRFKEIAAVGIVEGTAQADGDLSEWSGVRAQVVERRSQVRGGAGAWTGPDDASLGVAARRGEGELIVVVRIRDDHLLPGEDRIGLSLSASSIGELAFSLDLPEAPVGGRRVVGEGWSAVFAEAEPGEVALEVSFHPAGLFADDGEPDTIVRYSDADPGEEVTTLGTAAWPGLLTPARRPKTAAASLKRGP